MVKKSNIGAIVKVISALIFCAYCVLFLVGVISMIVHLNSVEGEALLLELEGKFGFGSSVGVWIGVILGLVYGCSMCVLAVIGIIKSRGCLNILMILLGILMLLEMLLISGMNFSSGTIILGFETKLVLTGEVGWSIFTDFLVKIVVLISIFSFNSRRDD